MNNRIDWWWFWNNARRVGFVCNLLWLWKFLITVIQLWVMKFIVNKCSGGLGVVYAENMRWFENHSLHLLIIWQMNVVTLRWKSIILFIKNRYTLLLLWIDEKFIQIWVLIRFHYQIICTQSYNYNWINIGLQFPSIIILSNLFEMFITLIIFRSFKEWRT